jgi:hypothetical protein
MDHILHKYINEVRDAECMLENELAMLESAQIGDKQAQKTLIQTYLYRTAEITLRLAPEGMDKLNALQEANIVLQRLVMQAPKPSMGHHLEMAIKNHFTTYNTQVEQLTKKSIRKSYTATRSICTTTRRMASGRFMAMGVITKIDIQSQQKL